MTYINIKMNRDDDRDVLMRRLRDMLDRNDILECMHRYARGMDRHDRALLRSAYHDDGIDDHGGFVGPVDEFIDWALNYHATQDRHQHYLTNHHVELGRDSAHAETYYLFVATERDEGARLSVAGGRYVDYLEKRDGRWAIVTRVCLIEWRSDAASLITPKFRSYLDRVQTVAQDRSDTSYERPLIPVQRVPR